MDTCISTNMHLHTIHINDLANMWAMTNAIHRIPTSKSASWRKVSSAKAQTRLEHSSGVRALDPSLGVPW